MCIYRNRSPSAPNLNFNFDLNLNMCLKNAPLRVDFASNMKQASPDCRR